jgi:hypothetical protein
LIVKRFIAPHPQTRIIAEVLPSRLFDNEFVQTFLARLARNSNREKTKSINAIYLPDPAFKRSSMAARLRHACTVQYSATGMASSASSNTGQPSAAQILDDSCRAMRACSRFSTTAAYQNVIKDTDNFLCHVWRIINTHLN